MAVLVGRPAPDFKTQAVRDDAIVEDFSLSQYRNQKYVVLFFYPLDFTFVCPTELHEFQAALADFHALDVEVIGASVDSAHSHLAWLRTPRQEGGIEGVKYPILSDFTKEISHAYDVLLREGMALRATFIIDKQGTVQAELVNNLPLGRNIAEVLRLVRALQFTEKHGEVCPANWAAGDEGMKADRRGVTGYFKGKKKK